MLEIYLIRHGETEFNAHGIHTGQTPEVPLNKTGIKQAEKLAARLNRIKFDKVFSSPDIRAKQTADILFRPAGIEIITDNRLREHETGGISQSSEAWVNEYKRLLNTGMSRYDVRPFGNENIWDLIDRVGLFLKDMEREEGRIAVVAHAGVNDVFINLAYGREKDEFVKTPQDNTAINIIRYVSRKWHVVTVNDSGHIFR